MTVDIESFKDLEAKVLLLEANLKSKEILSDSTVTKLEDQINSAKDQIASFKSHQESNESLRNSIDKINQKQHEHLSSRWSFVTGMTSFITLMVGFVFTYQVFRVEQVMETKKTMEKTAETLTRSVDLYTKILSLMSDIEAKLTYGTIEFSRSNFEHATEIASEAINKLEAIYFFHPLSNVAADFSGNPLACEFEGKSTASKQNSSTNNEHSELPLPPELKSSLSEMYFSALDFHARASFASENYENVREDAIKLGRINQAKPEPYHWMGLYYSSMEENEAAAQKCFEKSVYADYKGNPDLINLAEMALLNGDYKASFQKAKEFLKRKDGEVFIKPNNPRQLVALFYEKTSEYLKNSNSSEDLKKLREIIRDSTIELTGSYHDKEFQKFLASKHFSDLKENQKKEVSKTHICLVNRKECDENE